MPSDPQRRGRRDQPDFFDDDSQDATPPDPEAARIIKQFQRHEHPDLVDAELEEEAPAGKPHPEGKAAEPAREEKTDEAKKQAPAKEEEEQIEEPAPKQTEQQRADAKRYEAIHNRLFLADVLATVAALALFLFCGLSGNLRNFVENGISKNPFAAAAFYGIIVTLVYYFIALIPLHYLDYWYELRFGLSRQSFAAWGIDEFKSMGLNMIILVAFLEIVYGLLRATETTWWLWAAAAWTVLVVALTKLAPVLLIPIFYKKEPLADDELSERLRHLVERVQMSVVAVEKLGLGAKTVKANAMLAGLGSTKRVLLGDTLLEHFSEDEIETVLAHELGHHHYHHIWKHIAAGAVATFGGFFVASVVLRRLVEAFEERLGFGGVQDVATFPILAFALFVMALIAMPATNAFSRTLERQADRFALQLTRKPDAFISAMRRLAVRNLADPEPSRLVEALLHGHPSIARRIAAAERFKAAERPEAGEA
jgi:STE24 endopeptidase